MQLSFPILIKFLKVIVPSSGSPQEDQCRLDSNYVQGSLLGNGTSSEEVSRTTFAIGRIRIRVDLSLVLLSPINNFTDLTNPLLSGIVSITFAIGHSLRLLSVVFNKTISPTCKFLLDSHHFCLICKLFKNSFRHLDQNSFVMC